MMISRRSITAFASLLALIAVTIIVAEVRKPRASSVAEASTSVSKGDGFTTAATLLANTVGGVVAADVSEHDYRAVLAWPPDMPIDRMTQRMCNLFDRGHISRPRTVALPLKRSGEEDDLRLELEELRSVCDDVYQLVSRFDTDSHEQIPKLKQRFRRSLIPGLTSRLARSGVSASELPPAARQAWLRLFNYNRYSSLTREVARTHGCLSNWGPSTFLQRTRKGGLRVGYISAKQHGSLDWIQMSHLRGPGRPGLVPLETFPARSSHASTSAPWTFPPTTTTLADLASRARREKGLRITYPRYAADRRVWIYSPGGSSAEVFGTLCDLWGWGLNIQGSTVTLGRPRLEPAIDHLDLYVRVRAAIPPALRAYVANRSPDMRDTRPFSRAVAAEIAKLPKLASTSRLSVHAQQTLASNLLASQLHSWSRINLPKSPDEAHLRMILSDASYPRLTVQFTPNVILSVESMRNARRSQPSDREALAELSVGL